MAPLLRSDSTADSETVTGGCWTRGSADDDEGPCEKDLLCGSSATRASRVLLHLDRRRPRIRESAAECLETWARVVHVRAEHVESCYSAHRFFYFGVFPNRGNLNIVSTESKLRVA